MVISLTSVSWIWSILLFFKFLPYGSEDFIWHGPLTRYVKLRVAHAQWMPGTSPPPPPRRLRRKPLVNDPGMHHGSCVTHVPWCMSVSLARGGGENVPGIPGACAPAILRIWQEAHVAHWCEIVWMFSFFIKGHKYFFLLNHSNFNNIQISLLEDNSHIV